MAELGPDGTDRTGLRTRDHTVWVWAWIVVAAGSALVVARFMGTPPPGRGAEAAVGAVAFGAVVAAPGVLMMLSVRHGEPALLLAAGLALIPLSFISFALVTLPLLIPAFVSWRAWARHRHDGAGPLSAHVALAVATLGFLCTAFLALLIHQDPREWTGTTIEDGIRVSVGYATSDVITYAEAFISLALTGAVVLIGRSARPSRLTRTGIAPGASSRTAVGRPV